MIRINEVHSLRLKNFFRVSKVSLGSGKSSKRKAFAAKWTRLLRAGQTRHDRWSEWQVLDSYRSELCDIPIIRVDFANTSWAEATAMWAILSGRSANFRPTSRTWSMESASALIVACFSFSIHYQSPLIDRLLLLNQFHEKRNVLSKVAPYSIRINIYCGRRIVLVHDCPKKLSSILHEEKALRKSFIEKLLLSTQHSILGLGQALTSQKSD